MLDPQELAPDTPRMLRREEFDRMVELGMFDDERVELLRGVLVRMTLTSPPHDATLQRLTRLLVLAVGERDLLSARTRRSSARSTPSAAFRSTGSWTSSTRWSKSAVIRTASGFDSAAATDEERRSSSRHSPTFASP